VKRSIVALIMAGASGVSVWIFIAVDAGSHSVSDTLYGSVVPIGLVWLLALAVSVLAARTIRGS